MEDVRVHQYTQGVRANLEMSQEKRAEQEQIKHQKVRANAIAHQTALEVALQARKEQEAEK